MKKYINGLAVSVLSTLAFSIAGAATRADVKEWTILVYMNSDNNLWSFGQANMAEMEKVGSSPQVNVIVEQDPEPSGMPTTRYYVTQNPNPQPGKVTSKVLQQLGETDMGDWKHLAEFITWGATNFPAKHYAVIIWNHGAGWQGVSYDDHPRHFITMPDLAKGLKAANQMLVPMQSRLGLYSGNGPVIDIVNFDACLMSTIEVGFELKDSAKIMVGSQFLEPGEGENYTAFIAPLVQKPVMTAAEFSQVMVYQYAFRYASGGGGINYMALDLSKMANFTHAFSVVADNHLSAPANIQSQLKSTYRQNAFGGDLIGGMQAAQKISATAAPLAASLDTFVKMYGYPAETMRSAEIRSGADGSTKVYHIVRYAPGAVHCRYSAGGAWINTPLVRQVDGSYQAEMPAAPGGGRMQYVVSRNEIQDGRTVTEATSMVMREGADPIVFHNNFPASSPVIADAYNFATKGAHGMSLYFFSGSAVAKANPRLGTELYESYKALQFASVGAPSWTKFFGF